MKENIKALRVHIDGLAKILKSTCEIDYLSSVGMVHQSIMNHEMQKSYDDLILAKAWLGKVLEFIGEDSPYKNDGKRKTAADIEPTADRADDSTLTPPFDVPVMWWKDATHIEKIDWLRERIKGLIEDQITEAFDLEPSDPNTNAIISALNKHVHHLHEARFWLGFELQRIRESSK
jgi:hypothetical protein